jgi:hypothetical protein
MHDALPAPSPIPAAMERESDAFSQEKFHAEKCPAYAGHFVLIKLI